MSGCGCGGGGGDGHRDAAVRRLERRAAPTARGVPSPLPTLPTVAPSPPHTQSVGWWWLVLGLLAFTLLTDRRR